MRAGFISEVFPLTAGKDQDPTGQIYLSISLADSTDDSHELSVISGRLRTKDSSYFRGGDSRLLTEPAMKHPSRNYRDSQDQTLMNQKNPIQKNLNQLLSAQGSQSVNSILFFLFFWLIINVLGSQQYFSQPKLHHTSSKHIEKSHKFAEMESHRKNMKPSTDERDALAGNTLVTYQNDDDESIADEETNKYSEFFNMRTASDIQNFLSNDEGADSDYSEGEIDHEQLDEGYKRIKTCSYDKESSEDLSELQKILEAIKKDNAEISRRDEDLKTKFNELKTMYNRIVKEKNNLENRRKGIGKLICN